MGTDRRSGRRKRTSRAAAVLLAALAVATVLVVGDGRVTGAGAATLPRPDGAGPPVKASGMGTQAALDNPRCRHDDPASGPYGNFDSTSVGGGPACVKAWAAGDDNGGATAQGVTADRIKVVAYVPNSQQQEADPVPPKVRPGDADGTHADGIHDFLVPRMRWYETWGRDIELHFVTSSGSDEQAQRADAVAIKAMKPFVAVMISSTEQKEVLESELAAAGIVTWGYTASYDESAQQSPYRWGSADNDATAINAAEVLGKQLAGNEAEHGGADVNGKVRKFGVVHTGSIDYDGFVDEFDRYGGAVAEVAEVPPLSAEAAQAQAPTIIGRMKGAGVTTIVPFASYTTVTELMEVASQQDYFPEWFFTGASYQDIGILARGYPAEQSRHAFGISFIQPWTEPDPDHLAVTDPLTWYWGPDTGTFSARYIQQFEYWLLSGIHAAGPHLTAKTFKQGLFALPPRQGAAAGRPDSTMVAFGKGPKLPYDEYATTGYDFAPYWWDPETEGASNGTGTVGQGVGWYVDGGKRYVATEWPTRPIKWFDESKAIVSFPSRPGGPLVPVDECGGCPSSGGAGTPGAPSDTVVVFAAGGTGASAA